MSSIHHLTSKEPSYLQPQPYWRSKYVPYTCRHILCKHFTESSYNPQKKRCAFRFSHERTRHELKEHGCDIGCKICKDQRRTRANSPKKSTTNSSPVHSPKSQVDTNRVTCNFHIDDLRTLLELKESSAISTPNSRTPTSRINSSRTPSRSSNSSSRVTPNHNDTTETINISPVSNQKIGDEYDGMALPSHIARVSPTPRKLHVQPEKFTESLQVNLNTKISSTEEVNNQPNNSKIQSLNTSSQSHDHNAHMQAFKERPSTASRVLRKSPLDTLNFGRISVQYEPVTPVTQSRNRPMSASVIHSSNKKLFTDSPSASAVKTIHRESSTTNPSTPSTIRSYLRTPQSVRTSLSNQSITPTPTKKRPLSAVSRYRHRQRTESGADFPVSPLFVSNFIPAADPVLQHYKAKEEILTQLESEAPAPVTRRGSWCSDKKSGLQLRNSLNSSINRIQRS